MTNCAAREGVRTHCPMAEPIEICSVTQKFPILLLVWPDNDCSTILYFVKYWLDKRVSFARDDTHFHACAYNQGNTIIWAGTLAVSDTLNVHV